jgi:cellulose synthase/poly-beta-1,6-N-acetylglucosamine synthase-like glycosyltransferase
MRRFFEILPGALAWGTIILMFVLSAIVPTWVAIFIILFDTYWLLKALYLSFHLRATFTTMRQYMKEDWLARLGELNLAHTVEMKALGLSKWEDVYQLVLLPMYNEPYEIVRGSLDSLLKASYPVDKFIVALGLEEAGGEAAQETGRRIQEEYKDKFFKFLLTTHPKGLPGELQGKGSNESWMGERVKEQIIDPLQIPYERVMVSVFDVDTQIFPGYFGRLTYTYLTTPDPLRHVYQPIPFFTNNIYETPAIGRVIAFSCTFWQMMQQSRPERLTTFSSQSVPFKTIVDIGFWDRDIVSEDSRIFWQCYLHYDGNFSAIPLFFPVSMDANVAPSLWQTLKNLYKQQRRWGWGSENIPYMLLGFMKNLRISAAKKRYWTFNVLEGFHSWATNSLMIFLLGWLPLILGNEAFNHTLLSYNLPKITRLVITLSMVTIVSSAIIAMLLLPPKPKWFRPYHYAFYFLQWALLPFTLIIFGAFPGLEAQTRLMIGGRARLGFWVTPKARYTKQT